MDSILELFDAESLSKLINSLFGLGESLVSFFSTVFGWLGPQVTIAISIGIVAAIILRILGR